MTRRPHPLVLRDPVARAGSPRPARRLLRASVPLIEGVAMPVINVSSTTRAASLRRFGTESGSQTTEYTLLNFS